LGDYQKQQYTGNHGEKQMHTSTTDITTESFLEREQQADQEYNYRSLRSMKAVEMSKGRRSHEMLRQFGSERLNDVNYRGNTVPN